MSDNYLAHFLHAELSSNCLTKLGLTGRRRSSSLTVLTTLLTQQGTPLRLWASPLSLSYDILQKRFSCLLGLLVWPLAQSAVFNLLWSLLPISHEARGRQFYVFFFWCESVSRTILPRCPLIKCLDGAGVPLGGPPARPPRELAHPGSPGEC